MYSSKPSFVYGFHGLDKTIGLELLNQLTEFEHSNNDYDWLGRGVYFWENNLERAIQFATNESKRPSSRIKEPFVIGAIIDLGNCFDLLDQTYLDMMKVAYGMTKDNFESINEPIPTNSAFNPNDFDFKKRKLDCAVISTAIAYAKTKSTHYDSVRAAFWEGNELYSGAGFREQNHIQIAVRNPDCIKGIFLPRKKNRSL